MDASDEIGGRTALNKGDDPNPCPQRCQDCPLARIERIRPVIPAFYISVRPDSAQESMGAFLRENDDRIHTFQRGENTGPLPVRHERSQGAFEFAHRAIGIQSHDQQITQLLGPLEITHVAIVEQVKAAIRRNDALTTPPRGCCPTDRSLER